MKIAIISDTHGNVANLKKAVNWINKENIRVILHCGDIGNPESLKESLVDFKGELFGVLGNMDNGISVRAGLHSGWKTEEYNKISGVKITSEICEIELDKKKIAITHKPEDAKVLAESGKYDVVFYGHTHKPWEEQIPSGSGSCHMINPGELAGQFYKPTFAIYDTQSGKLELKILEMLD